MAEAAAVSVSTVTVGKTAAADKSVAPAALFAPKDDVIVSIKTDGAANNVNVGAKLTYQDGQVAGEQTATLNASGAETTNVTFKNAKGWPAGKYRADDLTGAGAAACGVGRAGNGGAFRGPRVRTGQPVSDRTGGAARHS
ncbi:hypothetical protein G6F50_016482 [Rhizopus delemar]|uniref:Uncharacterized protein n=1 Tax=Rhizopus delemar TaxID=936053 RepID=A0A9P6XT77_9FUNG|nr:hypothetical protein G6F50_016482 [Rhizopus delemar]